MGDPNNPLPSINHFEAYNILKEHKFIVISATRAILINVIFQVTK